MAKVENSNWHNSKRTNLGDKPPQFLVEKVLPVLRKRGDKSILDVGYFNGRIIKYLAVETPFEVCGVDLPEANEHMEKINKYLKLMDLPKAAFEADYSLPLKKILPVDSVDVSILWRVIHLLKPDELRNILKRTVEVTKPAGLIIITARKFTDDIKFFKISETPWPGVMKGKLKIDSPERLYFDHFSDMQRYLEYLSSSVFLWQDLAPKSFVEHEPFKNIGDKTAEAPCWCVIAKVL
jgi:SAM-dependent methyltransferase